jgi:hypothetical protein
MAKRLILCALVMGCCFLARPSQAQVSLVEDGCLTRAVDTMPAGDITIDATAGGVQVLATNTKRCSALIVNSGVAPMRCGPAGVTVSATVGVPLGAGASLPLNRSSRSAWKCIRTTGTSTSATIVESAVP